MQNDNNQSPRRKTEIDLTYKMWKRLKDISESNPSDQNQEEEYIKMLDFIEQHYSDAKIRLNESNYQDFTERISKLRMVMQ